jgi:cytoskeletal protein RodZ
MNANKIERTPMNKALKLLIITTSVLAFSLSAFAQSTTTTPPQTAKPPASKSSQPATTPPATKSSQSTTSTPQPQTSKPQSAGTCGSKSKCGEMSSCAEAKFYLNNCGLGKLDRDKDGIPCESLCK